MAEQDRELLKLAAKTMGYHYHGARVDAGHESCYVSETGDLDDSVVWAPLVNYRDVMRLAVKLRLKPNFEERGGTEYACAAPHNSHQSQDEVFGDDESAAVCRAFVRAAAAIGKAMP